MLDAVRPAKKTSAPSAASSVATAEPIEPPAPNTTARLSRNTDEVIIVAPSIRMGPGCRALLCRHRNNAAPGASTQSRAGSAQVAAPQSSLAVQAPGPPPT